MISPADYKGPDPGQAGSKPRKKSIWLRLLLWLVIAALAAGALGAGLLVGAWFWLSRDLPSVETLSNYAPPTVTKVLSHDGRLMAEFYRQRRYVVSIDSLPDYVTNAFVAAEDGDFYRHEGVDLTGIMRAALANFRAGRVVQGGSTITQQVAKAMLLTPQRTFVRKIKEMILARRMERYLSKRQILNLYVNHIYLGHGAYGVEAAARVYFGKPAQKLGVAEAALIAGLVQAPSRYSPIREPKRARNRQIYVIGRLEADGFITAEQAQRARREQMEVSVHRDVEVEAPYYAEAVRQWLMERYGEDALYDGGLVVETACDPALTAAGVQAINDGLLELTKRQGYGGPLGRVDASSLREAANRPYRPSGLAAGDDVTAIVTRLDPMGHWAELRFGGDRGRLALEDVTWAHRRVTDLDRGAGDVGRINDVLSPGDKVKVRLDRQQDGWWRLILRQDPFAQAALLAMDPHNGRVRVAIGGRDFSKSQFNRSLQASRQPGSAFKPFIYAAALDNDNPVYTAVSVIIDAPVVYDDVSMPGQKWKPKNYENRFYGPTTLRQALEHSRNVVTVKLLAEVGLRKVVNFAQRLGITSRLEPNLSLALGTSGVNLLELTRAYCVFANGGYLVQPVMVERVLDRNGNVLFQNESSPEPVLSPQTAFLTTHLMRGVMEEGTGAGVRVPGYVMAGKTGTTNDLRDAWFMGFTPDLACGVWVGQDDNTPLGRRETGARAAGPIWRQFMTRALEGQPPKEFTVPDGVVFCRVDRQSGALLPPNAAGGFFEAFRAGAEPTAMPANQPETLEEQAPTEFLQDETFAN